MTATRRAGPDQRWRGNWSAAAALAAALALSGCASSSGGSSDPPLTTRFSNLFSGSSASPSATPAAATAPAFSDEDCPSVDIRIGAGTLSITDKPGGDPTPTNVRYELSFNQLARQCSVAGSTLTVKVGVQGRIVVGPMGGPGQVSVPLRYAVVQEGPEPKPITTKFKRFAVDVAPGQSNVLFSDVETDLSFPLPNKAELDAYVVYVGYDAMGDASEKKPAPKKPAPKRQ